MFPVVSHTLNVSSRTAEPANHPAVQFFRCSPWFADTQLRVDLGLDLSKALASARSEHSVWQTNGTQSLSNSELSEWVDLLRLERYDQASTDTTVGAIVAREIYYLLRPLLGVSVRRHLQRFALRDWEHRPFPRWPVDRSVDILLELFLTSAARQKCVYRVPFVWFWPDGHSSCAMLTHDVETSAGLQFCDELMNMDDEAGIKSSFQLVPEQRYHVTEDQLRQFRERQFEVNIHDLNHDGHLFRDREKFLGRVKKINEYGKKFGSSGFRAGALYRNQEWFAGFDFEYDMSVPNVAHLDPQHGGCCTLFPYFVGNVLELPVTAIQDYSLFHVLETYSIETWRTQMSYIAAHHGMINVITHPDYVIEQKARSAYRELLRYMNELKTSADVWFAQPKDVNSWWRQRAQMELFWDRDHWSIRGPGSERAVVGYFDVESHQPEYQIGNHTAQVPGAST